MAILKEFVVFPWKIDGRWKQLSVKSLMIKSAREMCKAVFISDFATFKKVGFTWMHYALRLESFTTYPM